MIPQSNTVKTSLNRIYKTFARLKDKIYEEDINAFETLLNYFEETQKTIALTDKPYLKAIALLMYHYTQSSGSAKTGAFNLQKDLESPLGMLIENLKNQITNVNTIEFYKSVGLDTDLKLSELETKIKENEKEIIEQLFKEFTFEVVEKSLYKTANDLQFNNKINETI